MYYYWVVVSFVLVEVVSEEVGTNFSENDSFDFSDFLIEEASTMLAV